MEELDRAAVESALQAVYGKISEVAGALGEAEALAPSRCAGWAVADVLYHQLLDARRALRTFASPTPDPPDTDWVAYWRPYAPDSGAPAALGSPGAARHARHVRIAASAYTPDQLAWEWRETAGAAVRAARACQHPALSTQGHTLTVGDFTATLAVEAAIHYLDMTLARASRSHCDPRPDPAAPPASAWQFTETAPELAPEEYGCQSWPASALLLSVTNRVTGRSWPYKAT